MKIVRSKVPLIRKWSGHPSAKGLLLEKDIKLSSLKAKLLVFNTCRDLHAFWRDGLGKNYLGRLCRGAVNGLYCEIRDIHSTKPDKVRLEVDPNYFCVIGLVKGYLTMEIICHESVHAAFNYVKRKTRNPWDEQARDMDEEAVCYPAGRIAREINEAIFDAGLYAKDAK